MRSARRGLRAGCFARVVVASEDREIVDVARGFGLEALLTPVFETGTDRVAWAGRALGARHVVNLQGDEPVFPLDLLRELAAMVPTDPGALWTAADLALSDAERVDDDVVKIVLEPVDGDAPDARTERIRSAFDFHRSLPPSCRGEIAVHVGVYAGSVALLERFGGLARTDLERARRIEPLRALEAGIAVRAVAGRWDRAAVDRKEHISRVLDVLRRGE